MCILYLFPANDKSMSSIADVQLAVERRSSAQIYYLLIAFIAVMLVLLIWLTLR